MPENTIGSGLSKPEIEEHNRQMSVLENEKQPEQEVSEEEKEALKREFEYLHKSYFNKYNNFLARDLRYFGMSSYDWEISILDKQPDAEEQLFDVPGDYSSVLNRLISELSSEEYQAMLIAAAQDSKKRDFIEAFTNVGITREDCARYDLIRCENENNIDKDIDQNTLVWFKRLLDMLDAAYDELIAKGYKNSEIIS